MNCAMALSTSSATWGARAVRDGLRADKPLGGVAADFAGEHLERVAARAHDAERPGVAIGAVSLEVDGLHVATVGGHFVTESTRHGQERLAILIHDGFVLPVETRWRRAARDRWAWRRSTCLP